MGGPLKELLCRVLNDRALVWSYDEDFDSLWKLLRTGTDSQLTSAPHVILWSRTPKGDCHPVATGPFVSPIAWALCAASRVQDSKGLHVTIVDLAPLANAGAKLVSEIGVLQEDVIPWLRVLPWTVLLQADVDALRPVVLSMPGRPESRRSERSVALEQLRQTLRLALTDPSDRDSRHAVSNLVGPMVLLGNRFGDADGHRLAIRQLLETCGLLKDAEDPSHLGTTALPNGTRLILIDDQWEHGWGRWVCDELGIPAKPPSVTEDSPVHSLGGPGSFTGVELCVASSPEWLLPSDSENETPPLPRPENSRDRRLRLNLTGARAEILLLDLRLFSGDEAAEREFVRKLLPLCRRFEGDAHAKPVIAWAPFDKNELDQVEAWTRGEKQDEVVKASAKTLLPRLLALTDFSLPIVLFSSTGDRDMLEPLRSYGNIITSFSKPRFFGGVNGEVAIAASEGFHAALRGAARLLRARERLCEMVGDVHEQPRDERTRVDKDTQVAVPHVSLYVDETGDFETDNEVGLGGIVAVYPSHDEETTLNQLLATYGLHFGPGKEKRPSIEVRETFGQAVLKHAHAAGVRLHGLSLRAQPADWRDGSVRVADQIGKLDNLHRKMTQALIELAVFGLTPRLIDGAFSLSIFTDRRAGDWPNDATTQGELKRFGFGADHGKDERGDLYLLFESLLRRLGEVAETATGAKDLSGRVREFRRDNDLSKAPWLLYSRVPSFGVLTTWQQIEQRYRDSGTLRLLRELHEARAESIGSVGTPKAKKHLTIHFMTDWLVSPGAEKLEWVKTIRDAGAAFLFTPGFERSIEIARLFEDNQTLRGLSVIFESSTPPDLTLFASGTCANAVSKALNSVTGHDFVEAARVALAGRDYEIDLGGWPAGTSPETAKTRVLTAAAALGADVSEPRVRRDDGGAIRVSLGLLSTSNNIKQSVAALARAEPAKRLNVTFTRH